MPAPRLLTKLELDSLRLRVATGYYQRDSDVPRLLATLDAADKAADDRWCAALEKADWDGGVFHYEGRIYPWPRGFVPDVPATWASKLDPIRTALKNVVSKFRGSGRQMVLAAPGIELEQAVDAARALVGDG